MRNVRICAINNGATSRIVGFGLGIHPENVWERNLVLPLLPPPSLSPFLLAREATQARWTEAITTRLAGERSEEALY